LAAAILITITKAVSICVFSYYHAGVSLTLWVLYSTTARRGLPCRHTGLIWPVH